MEQCGGAWVVHDTRISCLGGSCDFYRIRHCRRAASRASLRRLSARGRGASLPRRMGQRRGVQTKKRQLSLPFFESSLGGFPD